MLKYNSLLMEKECMIFFFLYIIIIIIIKSYAMHKKKR